MDRPSTTSSPAGPLRRSLRAVLAVSGALAVLGGCSSGSAQKVSVWQREGFAEPEAYARLFDAPAPATCEAARRALLSQGYLIDKQRSDAVSATKSFQPDGEVHVQITFHVVCVPEAPGGRIATAFVSALQDRYTLKKSSNSASLGLNALGSVSIPMGATGESLVKVGSETIPAGPFYDRFFALMGRFIADVSEDAAIPATPVIEPPPPSATKPAAAASSPPASGPGSR